MPEGGRTHSTRCFPPPPPPPRPAPLQAYPVPDRAAARPRAAADASSSSSPSAGPFAVGPGAYFDPAFDVRLLPLGPAGLPALPGRYPMTYPLRDILGEWNPGVTSLPAHYGKYASLRVFDLGNAADAAEAEVYRRWEVPFVVRNVSAISGREDSLVRRWATDAGFVESLGTQQKHQAESALCAGRGGGEAAHLATLHP